jgi:hypothetical protein
MYFVREKARATFTELLWIAAAPLPLPACIGYPPSAISRAFFSRYHAWNLTVTM